MYIDGPTGQLEAELDKAEVSTGGAILCHPHPQYGGSMHDHILQIASQTLNQRHLDCLRFNFRGVGQSEGHFDHGEGECQDLLAAIHWLTKEGQTDGKPWLLGYSFGANVVWNVLAQLKPEQVAGVILIAPPVGKMHFASHPLSDLPCNVYAVAGNRDEFVDQTAFRDWSGVKTQVIEGADHFFMQQSKELTNSLDQFLS